MTTLQANVLIDGQNQLGEGIQWNAQLQRVFWTDIFGNKLFSCDENGDAFHELDLEGGLCAFAFKTADRLLAAFTDGLYWLDRLDGSRKLIRAYQPEHPLTRMNDGGLDRQGRFIVGGYDDPGMAPVTPVWSVSSGGIHDIIADVSCANSLVFSPEGSTMYFADTSDTDIFAFDYDVETGTPTNKRLFAKLEGDGGAPDGSTVDAEGAVWNAGFGGYRVQRFLADGTPDLTVQLPVPNVTCCAIGGRNLDRMFITTARILMSDRDLIQMPQAGGMFAVDLPVRGPKAGRFTGSTS